MSEPTNKQRDRDARLTAQLRENLHRRKRQARSQAGDRAGDADPPLPKAPPES